MDKRQLSGCGRPVRGRYSSKGAACHDLLCNDAGLYIYEFVFRLEAVGTAEAEKEGGL
ncbi:hypothetical protein ABFV83_09020 [Lacrimispora sp. BS-2]|uniref:Uncharacterized protein n=1 Tax=Lacrimispora sp. BS-2 TaxID=3151850 RepID=A0AAU7PUF6_9FIRM